MKNGKNFKADTRLNMLPQLSRLERRPYKPCLVLGPNPRGSTTCVQFAEVHKTLNLNQPPPLSLILLKNYYIIYIVNEKEIIKMVLRDVLSVIVVCFPWRTANSGSSMELDEQPFYQLKNLFLILLKKYYIIFIES